ncbi:MAG: PD40 domain-containing protein [Acidobacteria bacterium]|nr:PD40 domain-containing protein [Acidobacteriota bacterium]
MPQSLNFGTFRFDIAARRLYEDAQELTLNPKSLDLLAYLILNPHRIVSKEEILHKVWSDTAVTDDAIVQRVLDIRKALRDNPRSPVYVRTHPKRGYEWIADPNSGAVPKRKRQKYWPIALAAAVVLFVAIVALTKKPAPHDLSVRRLTAMPGMEDYPATDPKGARIVFASNESGPSKLWLLDAKSGERTALTQGDANDSEPDWSPDGRWIAFRSERGDGGLFLTPPEGGEPVNLAAYGHHPRWSPDSRRILFHTEGSGGKIFTLDVAAKSIAEISISTPNLMNRAFPVWSPDAKFIYILAILAAGSHVDGAVTLGHQIWRIPTKGGQAQLVSPGIGVVRDGGFDISADGAELVYIGLDRSLWKLSVNGKTVQRLTLTTEEHQHPRFAGDGGILFSTVSSPDGLWLIPEKPAKMERLTRDGALARSATLSPDRKLVAYITWAGERFEIWCLDMESRKSWRISPSTGPSRTRPLWSNDGKTLVYSVLDGAKREEVAGFLDGNRRQVVRELPVKTNGSLRNAQFTVSATGEVTSLPAPNLQIENGRWSLDGGRPLTLQNLSPSNPEWSPDGNRLYFQAARGGWFNIWSLPVRPEVGTPAPVTNFTGSPHLLSDMNREFAVHPLGLIVSLRENRSDLWLIK